MINIKTFVLNVLKEVTQHGISYRKKKKTQKTGKLQFTLIYIFLGKCRKSEDGTMFCLLPDPLHPGLDPKQNLVLLFQ